MLNHELLPPELWLEILSWAAQPSSQDPNAHNIDYTPFQSAPTDTRDSALGVKRTLTMVCCLWRIWTVHFLYRDIKIHHGARALRCALGAAHNHEEYGRLVGHFCKCSSYCMCSLWSRLGTPRGPPIPEHRLGTCQVPNINFY
ncbi:hypothetical protein P691DRAFT_813183 [Macrolepiota fuliginosa MF-IS2]|uniref:Uncharacterized protein n=1 Tax=Macrolepiota fuliginosa MF-IS2 TaxID=1400762 RepID=A0A9P6C221_9AGAR|nr:hypothetical protein P691DRAFT_813183 [Macrolepiota fuliginosa MF-IS2]